MASKPVKSVIKPDGRSAKSVRFTCGVYEILHVPTARRYVGSSAEVEKRLYWHLVMLRKNNHHCGYLQNVWNKYGETGFRFFLLEVCDRGELGNREQFHMDLPSPYQLMNLEPEARVRIGWKHTKRTKVALAAAAKARGNTDSERRIRSERAKAQHARGNIPYRKKIPYSQAKCKVCGKLFLNQRKSNGQLEQRKICGDCKVTYVPPRPWSKRKR